MVNSIIQGADEAKPYEIDWDHVLKQYNKLDTGDSDEFCYSYTFGYQIFNRKLEDKVSKEGTYMELRNRLYKLVEKEEIPKSHSFQAPAEVAQPFHYNPPRADTLRRSGSLSVTVLHDTLGAAQKNKR